MSEQSFDNGESSMLADIVIVGAGMVGSAIALALQPLNLKIVLLDGGCLTPSEFDSQSPFAPRVSALSLASERILTRLNAWPGVLKRRACPYYHMQVWDGDGTGNIEFSASQVHANHLGHIVENHLVQDALLEQIANSNITCLANTRLEQLTYQDAQWQLTLSDQTQLSAKLVIAADGANSAVRRLTQAATREWDYLHHAIVTSIQTEQPHQHTAWQRFTDSGPIALLPLAGAPADQHWCSIVWSTTPEQAEQLLALDDAAFCQTLGKAFEHRLGDILHADPRFSIPLRQRHLKRYVQAGLAFIGDAAHTIHPLAGQGVNMGFLDAACLAETLEKAQLRGEDLASEQVLSRFERQRMPHNLSMMGAMEGFQHLFQSDHLALRLVRNLGLNLINQTALTKSFFTRQALGEGAHLPKLAQPFS